MVPSPFTGSRTRGGEVHPGGTPAIGGDSDGPRVLAPLLTPERPALTDQLEIAATFARTTGASLQLLTLGRVPDRTLREVCRQIDDPEDRLDLGRRTEASGSTEWVDVGVATGRRLVDETLRAVDRDDVDTLVLPGTSPSDLFGRAVTDRIAVQADCDVVVTNGRHGYDPVRSILVPIAGGPHSGLAADVARRIAEDCEAWVDVLHVVGGDAPDVERDLAAEYVDAAARRIGRPETTSTWILEAEDVAEAIAEQSGYYGLTVLGAPTTGRLRQFLYGSTTKSIRANARSVVLSARANGGTDSLHGD